MPRPYLSIRKVFVFAAKLKSFACGLALSVLSKKMRFLNGNY